MTISSPESEKEWWAVVFLRVISVTLPSPARGMNLRRTAPLVRTCRSRHPWRHNGEGPLVVRPVIVLIVSFLPCLAREQ